MFPDKTLCDFLYLDFITYYVSYFGQTGILKELLKI